MSEKLKIDEILNVDQQEEFNALEIHDECLIDPDEEIEQQPIAVSIGYKFSEYTPLVTYGNFCCIVGASKSMKSFFKSAILACYIGGKAQNYFTEIKGHDTEDKVVIDIDTEQSKFHVQKIVKRVNTMVGTQYKGYKAYALRPKTAHERVQFIDWLFNESEFKGRIGVLSIDGVADLVENVNDLDASNQITQKLMTWSAENNCAIITVLHRNFESDKPTGHLGSAILKKSETVVFVNKDEDGVVSVKPKYTRNIGFDDFMFSVDENGIPKENNVMF